MFKKILLSFLFLMTFSLIATANPVNKLFHQAGDPVLGNPKGKVTVVEFFDYQCGHCTNMAPILATIIKANPDVRVVYKEFPIRGPLSEYSALAALAANKQGKYAAFSHELLTKNVNSESDVLDIAKSVNLNVSKLQKDMKSSNIRNIVNNNYALARELNVNGTPTFFIGKTSALDSKEVEETMGEMSQTELQQAINKAKA